MVILLYFKASINFPSRLQVSLYKLYSTNIIKILPKNRVDFYLKTDIKLEAILGV